MTQRYSPKPIITIAFAATSISALALSPDASIQRSMMFVALGLSLLFVVIIAIAYRRARHMTKKLNDINKSIAMERDSIKRAHKSVFSANERTRLVNRKKNEFIHNLSRNIAKPTSNIVSYAQVIIDSVDETSRPILQGYIKVVQDNSSLLRSLVNDVIDSADLEHARITVTINNFSLSDAVHIAAATMRNKLQSGVKMNIRSMTPETSDMIDSDPKRVEQIILNILINAAKFTSIGHIDVDYAVERENGTASVIVTDTGIGIPEGKEDIIFNRFEKLNPATQGLGLGLYVCRMMAQLIGGKVYVDSRYDKGARFIFTFPITGNEDASGSKNLTIPE